MFGPDSPDPIARARHRNERQIALLVIVIGLCGAATAAWRMISTGSGGGLLMTLSLGISAFYALLYVRLRRGKPLTMWRVWVRAAFEVSAGFGGMIINLNTVGPEFALTSGVPFLFGFAVAVSCLRLDPHLPLFVATLGIIGQIAFYLWVREDVSHILSLSVPIFAFRLIVLFVTGVLGVILARSLRSETEKASEELRLRSAFGTYVDSRVVERVMRGDLQLAPERRVVTVMFVDIRDFTQLSEKRDAAEVFRMLDAVLDAFATEVQKQGGIVNKFLGDGLMALFGAPEEQPDHPRRAVRSALRIAQIARQMAADGRFPELKIGIGIHTGEVVAGDIGRQRREYTAIGDVVNVAARVESANKELGTTILITGDVRELLGPGADLEPQTPLVLRGRTRSVEVFEVRDLSGTLEHPAAMRDQ